MSANVTPLDERNSFVAWQGRQVGVEKTITRRWVTRLTSPSSIVAHPAGGGNRRALTPRVLTAIVSWVHSQSERGKFERSQEGSDARPVGVGATAGGRRAGRGRVPLLSRQRGEHPAGDRGLSEGGVRPQQPGLAGAGHPGSGPVLSGGGGPGARRRGEVRQDHAGRGRRADHREPEP